jgi:hypothetical protein
LLLRFARSPVGLLGSVLWLAWLPPHHSGVAALLRPCSLGPRWRG